MKLLPLLFLLFSVLNLTAEEAKEYKLEKDDVIRMVVFQESELGTEAQIGKSGYVSFPLIGNVKIIDKSLKRAEDEIKALYEKEYLVNAQVNLSIISYADKWVIVGGDVRSPGTIKYPEEGALDLRGAVAQAGGELGSADITRIVVRSKSGSIKTYNLKNSGGKILKHGDSVTIPRNTLSRSTITVSGHVNKPGIVEFPKQGGMDIITAIARAGSYTRIANKNDVVITRGGRRIVVSLKEMRKGKIKLFQLSPGDIIIVQESRW